MTTLAIPEKELNIIPLTVVNGCVQKKEEIKYNLDGSVKRTHTNKFLGEDSEVYAFRTAEEIKAMINVFDKHIADATRADYEKAARRNKMLFILGINIGIRGSDLCNLQFKTLLNTDGTFKQGQKIQPEKTRNKRKYVWLAYNQAVQVALTDYIKYYPIENMDDFIFQSRKGGAITRVAVGRMLKEAAEEAGIIQNINSHSLRKTFGYQHYIHSVDKGQAVVYLQQIFNHKDQLTTLKYIGILQQDLTDFYNNINLGIE